MESKKGKEVYKYDKLYNREGLITKKNVGTYSYDNANKEQQQKWDRYGHANEGKGHFEEIISMKPSSVLDIGCGWNEMCKNLKPYVSEAVGLDCSCSGADIIASAHDLPIDDKSFDLIISFDCMEHIPEEEVEECFSEFARVGDRMFLKIALQDTTTRIDGESLHSCVKPKEWWINIAEKYFTIIDTTVERPNTVWESLLIKGDAK